MIDNATVTGTAHLGRTGAFTAADRTPRDSGKVQNHAIPG